MKNLLLLLVFCFYAGIIRAQDESDIGKIPLSAEMVPANDDIDANGASMLEQKIAQVIAASGMSSAGYAPVFSIQPRFTVLETNTADGGMQSITVVKAELNLFLKQDNGALINSLNKQLKGSGTNRAAAINNAIANISAADQDFIDFISAGREKILIYYKNKCGELMTLAENMAKKKDYEGAIGLLMSVPIEATSCYKAAQQKSVTLYTAYENQVCQSLIVNARAKIAATNYVDALDLLKDVDPSSVCGAEAKHLIAETGLKVAAAQKREWDMALKIYEDNILLEKYRIDALKEVAVASYKKAPRKHKRK